MIPFVILHFMQYLNEGGDSLLTLKPSGKDNVCLSFNKMWIRPGFCLPHPIIYNRCILAKTLKIRLPHRLRYGDVALVRYEETLAYITYLPLSCP